MLQSYNQILDGMGDRKERFLTQLEELAQRLRQTFPSQEGVDIDQIDFRMLALEKMWNGQNELHFYVKDQRREDSKPLIDDHLTLDEDYWNWVEPSQDQLEDSADLQDMGRIEAPKALPGKVIFGATKDRKEKSVEAAINELSNRMKTKENGGNGLVPNFRIAVKAEKLVQEWMKEPPIDFSTASDEDLINYIKRQLANIGVFNKEVKPDAYRELNGKVDDLAQKDAIVAEVRGLLRKGADGKVAPEVRKYIEMVGSSYMSRPDDVLKEENKLAFLTTIVRPFHDDLLSQDANFALCEPNNLIRFICENYEQILSEN